MTDGTAGTPTARGRSGRPRPARWTERTVGLATPHGELTITAAVYGPLAAYLLAARAGGIWYAGTVLVHVRSGAALGLGPSVRSGARITAAALERAVQRARHLVESIVADPACWWDWDRPPVTDLRYLRTVERVRAQLAASAGELYEIAAQWPGLVDRVVRGPAVGALLERDEEESR